MTTELCVFDAYGTLFDVDAAARALAHDEPRLRDIWPRLAADWRRKQLEYSWLREVMGDYVDFWQLTRDGLDWAMEAQGLDDPTLAARLMDLYRELPAFPEVPAMLEALRARGVKCAILSNGAPDMLASAVQAAGLAPLLDAVISVDALRRFKPAMEVYGLVETQLAISPAQTSFISSNGWDAAGAARFGFRVVWANRAGAPTERLSHSPDVILPDLTSLPDHL
ncbi:haloacid dehalogenase type II [Thioclava sp. BHET1]|nr:haloacid dehalogenase type II [Thioclava sp. BHET1]